MKNKFLKLRNGSIVYPVCLKRFSGVCRMHLRRLLVERWDRGKKQCNFPDRWENEEKEGCKISLNWDLDHMSDFISKVFISKVDTMYSGKMV